MVLMNFSSIVFISTVNVITSGRSISSSHVNQHAIFVHDADKIVSTQNLWSFIVTVQFVVNGGCS